MTTDSRKEPPTKSHHMQEGETTPRPQRNQLLRQARKERHWTQAELAEKVGVNNETISRWESGANKPQPHQLRKLCEVFEKTQEELGYPLERMSIGEGTPSPPPPERVSTQGGTPLSSPLPQRWSSVIIGGLSGLIVALLILAVVGRFVFHPSTPALPTQVPSPSCRDAFDEFHGKLDSRWHLDNPSGNAIANVAPKGPLSISAPTNSDINPNNNFDAPRLLQPIAGNFTVETRVQVNPTTFFQSAGILIWQGPTRFLRFEQGYYRNSIGFEQDNNGLFSGINPPSHPPTLAGPIELRLQRHGDHFTASWRVPGQILWQDGGGTDLHFDNPVMVGLDVLAIHHASQTTAHYDYFRVSCA